jgi:PBP1b-binding outer membrane lipoprotein LpoB
MKNLLLTLTATLLLIGCNKDDSDETKNNNQTEEHKPFLYIDATNRALQFEDETINITIDSPFSTVLKINHEEIAFINRPIDFSQENNLSSNTVIAQLHFHNEHFDLEEAIEIDEINKYIEKQHHLHEEINRALQVVESNTTLCNFFIDTDDAHYALTTTGKMYRFIDNNTTLEVSGSAIQLTNVASITQCHQTSIMQTSDAELAVFVAEAGHQYFMIDSHGADYHLHTIQEITEASALSLTHVLYLGEVEHDEHSH